MASPIVQLCERTRTATCCSRSHIGGNGEEFRQSFYPFFTLEDHLGHLAQLFTRGIVDNGEFIEGYGPAKEMGISFKEISGGLYTDVEGLDIPSR